MPPIEPLRIPIRRLDPALPLPSAAHPGDAGLDLRAAAEVELVPAGGRGLVPTGLAIAIPEGFAGFVQPRSGLALRHGVTVLNSPGLIDAGYRDEISVLLVNLDPTTPFIVRRGERIAQLVIQAVASVAWSVVESLEDSDRGTGGWGSTGV